MSTEKPFLKAPDGTPFIELKIPLDEVGIMADLLTVMQALRAECDWDSASGNFMRIFKTGAKVMADEIRARGNPE